MGANELFDIYVRQNGRRVSSNLCGDEADGSCRSASPVASAEVTMPVELEDSGDYRLLVRERERGGGQMVILLWCSAARGW